MSGVIYGLGLRKSSDRGWAKIVITHDAVTGFTSDPDGSNPVLTIAADVGEARSFMVDGVLTNIRTTTRELDEFANSDRVEDAIAMLLTRALRQTLIVYYGFCMVSIPGLPREHTAFVFTTYQGKYIALTTTSKISQAPGTVYVNYLQSGLQGRTFWRPTFFVPLEEGPRRVSWGKPIDIPELRAVVKSAVLTFNAFNCDHEVVCNEDGSPLVSVALSDESPYSLG